MESTNTELITDEHREYEPTQKDLFISIPSGEYQRLIWAEPNELRTKEEDHWDGFEDYIKENNLDPLPEGFTGSDRLGFRFLQGCLWNNEAAYKEMF